MATNRSTSRRLLGRRQEINLILNQMTDALLIIVAFVSAYWLRVATHDLFPERFDLPEIPPIADFFWIAAISAPFIPLILEAGGFYANPLQKSAWRSLEQVARGFLWMSLVIGGFVVFLKWSPGSRTVLPIFAIFSAVLLLIKERLVQQYLRKKVRTEGLLERVIIAGTPEAIEALIDGMPEEQRAIISVVGKIDLSKENVADLVKCMHAHSAERVLFTTAHIHFDKIERAIHACETEGVEAWLAADFIQTSIARPSFDVFGGRPMIVFRTTPDISWSLLFKDIIDRVGALALIVLSSPFWLIAYLGIRLKSPGAPVIFRQNRSGRNGRPFSMLKFRSMHPDAESQRSSLTEQNKMTGPVFKIDDDPRIFEFGKFIRRTSIDELPQLINVLAGDMSLVGPRPLPTYEIESIDDKAQRRRLSVKPGLTCLWQINGRNKITSFEDWVKLDLQYIDNWSIWLDISILLRTVPAVLFGSGAK
ncbi:sugar transferase [Verrucomicrobiales bacterium]|nr:sugar transferase [Verrucomicrobiales bacterium]